MSSKKKTKKEQADLPLQEFPSTTEYKDKSDDKKKSGNKKK